MLRRWSTPTVQNYRIDQLYKESDQRMWFHKCPHCGYEQVLDFDKNIKLVNKDGIDIIGKNVLPGTYQYVCQKCGKPLDRWYSGHWEPTATDVSGRNHGYSISQMDAVWITPDMLKREEMRSPSKQFFYNYLLGKPYEDKSLAFRADDVLNNIGDYERPISRDGYVLVSAGIDWGQHFHHLVILGMTSTGEIHLIRLKQIPKSEGVEHIEEDLNMMVKEINQYQPDIIIADIGYNGGYVDKLTAYYGKERMYGCIVNPAKSNGDYIAHFNDADSTVRIDKLTQNVIMLSNIKRGDIKFWQGSQNDRDVRLFIDHWENVVFRTDEKSNDSTHMIELQKTILRKGDDHFAQSSVYSMVGLDRLMAQYAKSKKTQLDVSLIDSDLLSPEKTSIQREYDL